MNKIMFMGRIANDLELKTTPNGTTVCSFRLAVDRNYQKKGEDKVTDFFNIVAWKQTAEFVTRYFGKGRMILIEGEMQTRGYTDKNGNNATWYEVVAWNVYFTGEKAADQNAPKVTQIAASAPAANYTSAAAAPPPPAEVYDDDYPF